MSATWEIVLAGVPVSSRRGALGWCNVVLVRHRGRTILFDTGSYGDRHALLSRLAALGVAPADVDLVFASHFHFDHVVNAEVFSCPILLSAEERRYVDGEGFVASGDPFVPRSLIPFTRDRIETVRDGDEIAPGLRAVLLPGHTPGTTGLLLADEGVLLAGDAVKNAWDFVRDEPPPAFFSRETAPANYRRVRELAGVVVPGHDRPFRPVSGGSVEYLGPLDVSIDTYLDPAAEPRPVHLNCKCE